VGDKTLAKFLRGLPLADQVDVRGTLIHGLSAEEFANGADVDYLQRYFPETTKILFRGDERFGPANFYPTIGSAVDAYLEEHAVDWKP
jgi:hypothetical protein